MDRLVAYNAMDFVWVRSHYDIHLEGLCCYNGRVCKFQLASGGKWVNDGGYMPPVYKVSDMGVVEKIAALFEKKMFEIIVGYHWTYPHRKRGVVYSMKRPYWFWKIMTNIYYRRRLFK